MVIGLGIDVCSIERMQRALDRFGERFWERILTEGEREDLGGRADRGVALAGRFAAKEAAAKALGAPRDVWWHHLAIRRGTLGAPRLELWGPAAVHAQRLGVVNNLVSITHDGGVAAAVVILEGGQS